MCALAVGFISRWRALNLCAVQDSYVFDINAVMLKNNVMLLEQLSGKNLGLPRMSRGIVSACSILQKLVSVVF